MSSLIRRIERTLTRNLKSRRGRHFMGRGSKLGHTNPKAKDLLARKAREARHSNKKGN